MTEQGMNSRLLRYAKNRATDHVSIGHRELWTGVKASIVVPWNMGEMGIQNEVQALSKHIIAEDIATIAAYLCLDAYLLSFDDPQKDAEWIRGGAIDFAIGINDSIIFDTFDSLFDLDTEDGSSANASNQLLNAFNTSVVVMSKTLFPYLLTVFNAPSNIVVESISVLGSLGNNLILQVDHDKIKGTDDSGV